VGTDAKEMKAAVRASHKLTELNRGYIYLQPNVRLLSE
jgi:hypothetical protein